MVFGVWVSQMKIGNILASIGIIIGVLGFLMLPFYNFHELPFIADSGYAKGGGWMLIAQSGIFKWQGLYMVITGVSLVGFAKLLPKKHWTTLKKTVKYEIKGGKKKRIKTDRKT